MAQLYFSGEQELSPSDLAAIVFLGQKIETTKLDRSKTVTRWNYSPHVIWEARCRCTALHRSDASGRRTPPALALRPFEQDILLKARRKQIPDYRCPERLSCDTEDTAEGFEECNECGHVWDADGLIVKKK
jgi:hypothetical protein